MAGRTSGWSPSTMRAAPTPGDSAPIPTRSDDESPAAGSGFRMRRSPRHRIAASTSSARAPRTTTVSPTSDAETASRTCWRTGRPARSARTLVAPKRDDSPAARTTAPTRPASTSASRDIPGRTDGVASGDDGRACGLRPCRVRPGRDVAGPLHHRSAGAAVASGDYLGHDRERGLGRIPPAEVQADRPTEPRQFLVPDAGPAKAVASIRLGLVAIPRPPRSDSRARGPSRWPARRTSRRATGRPPRPRDRGRSRRPPHRASPPSAGRRRGTARASRTPAVRRRRPSRTPWSARSPRGGSRPAPRRRSRSAGRRGNASTNSERSPTSTVRDVPRRSASAACRRTSASSAGSPRVPSSRPSSHATRTGAGGSPWPGGCGPIAGPGASPGSGITTAHAPPEWPVERPGSPAPARSEPSAVFAVSGG